MVVERHRATLATLSVAACCSTPDHCLRLDSDRELTRAERRNIVAASDRLAREVDRMYGVTQP